VIGGRGIRATGRRIAVWSIVAAAALSVVAIAVARESLDGAVDATAAYHDVDKAIAAGYTFRLPELSGNTCITEPGVGGMGVHMVNPDLLDSTIDATTPEAMVYEPEKHGRLKLAAVEYVVFQSAWQGSEPPSLFGREFALIPEPNRFGLPAFYALHAWIWKENPTGLLSTWNPRVTCEQA
jgi:hypothetical protein